MTGTQILQICEKDKSHKNFIKNSIKIAKTTLSARKHLVGKLEFTNFIV